MAPAASLPAALNHLPSDSWSPLTLSSVFHWLCTRTPGHGAGLQAPRCSTEGIWSRRRLPSLLRRM